MSKKSIKKVITRTSAFAAAAVVGLTLAMANTASAAELLYEGFDYTDSGGFADVKNQNGGTGWAGAWTETKFAMADVRDGTNSTPDTTQTYGALPVSGLGATSALGVWGHGSRLIGTTLSDAGVMADGAELWFSLLMNNDVANLGAGVKNGMVLSNADWSGTNQENLNNGAGDAGIGVIQSSFGSLQAGLLGENVDVANTGLDLTPGTILVVGQIIWGTGGGDETLNIYTPDMALVQGGIVTTHTFGDVDQSTFDRVALLTKNEGKMDEIRFGATYNSVVGLPDSNPVPAPAALPAGLMLLGAAAARRRRRS